MIVLITGVTGFLGRHLAAALSEAGHEVVGLVRRPPPVPVAGCVRLVSGDFTRDFDEATWEARLAGIDVVINAVGILREHGGQTFESLHVRAPMALFDACVRSGVRRVIQVSALGADAHARSAYHRSKRDADDFLRQLRIDWVIVQPSLVYGPGGRSARMFEALATAPFIPIPGEGRQLVQPVHADDVAAGVVALVNGYAAQQETIPFVGPRPLALRDFLATLRASMGLGPARFIRVAHWLVRLAANVGEIAGAGLLDRDTEAMLERGSWADAQPLQRVLGHPPRAPENFIGPSAASERRQLAQLRWLVPPMAWSLALLWIVSGAVSLGLYPTEKSLALLEQVGASGTIAKALLYGAGALDLAIGVSILLLRRRRRLWYAQMIVIIAYTLIISLRLPMLWLEPFGPVLKNLPLLAMAWLLAQLEER